MLRKWIALSFVFVAGAASADGFNYNFFNAGYGVTDLDGADGDSLSVDGSFAIADNWHLVAGYGLSTFDEGGVDLDTTTIQAGVGYNTPISENIDVIANVSYVYADFDIDTPIGNGSADDNGFGLGVGLRAQVSELVELNGGVSYIDLNDVGDDTVFSLGALFNVTETIALGIGGSFSDDADGYSAGVRFYF